MGLKTADKNIRVSSRINEKCYLDCNINFLLITSCFPADLQPYAGKDAALWGDGSLARFSLITPPGRPMKTITFPEGVRQIPPCLYLIKKPIGL